MTEKLTYTKLEQSLRELENEAIRCKKTEEALRNSERKMRSLIETTSDRVWEVDRNGFYVYTSSRVKNLLGYDVDEIVGNMFFKYLTDESKERTINFFNDKSGSPESFTGWEINMVHKDGKIVTLEVNGAPIFDNAGKLSGWCGFDKDITERKKAGVLLEKAYGELAQSNDLLKREVEERKYAELALKEREKELNTKTRDLEEVNSALRVLLKQREGDKVELEEKMLSNVKQLVEPYFEKLKMSGLHSNQRVLLDIIEYNLNEIISPFVNRLSSRYLALTPAEIRMANLVKQGKTSKEIAELLNLSNQTIDSYRKSVRQKLGIANKKVNLRTRLMSIQD